MSNDIADKIIRGENIDLGAALAEEQKQRQRREADAVKLQLLCARIAKAIGRNVEQRTLMGALAIMTAQAICHVHPVRHGRLYVDFLQALKAAIEGTYPKGQLLQPPDMSVLDRHIEVRTFTPPADDALDNGPEPTTSVEEPTELRPDPTNPSATLEDDLAIPEHLKRTP